VRSKFRLGQLRFESGKRKRSDGDEMDVKIVGYGSVVSIRHVPVSYPVFIATPNLPATATRRVSSDHNKWLESRAAAKSWTSFQPRSRP